MLLTEDEKASIAAEFEGLMESTGQLYRFVEVSDGAGGFTGTWTPIGSPTPCHAMYSTQRPPKEEEGTVLKQVKTYAYWNIWFPLGFTCESSDIVQINSKYFQVVVPFSPRTYEFAFHIVAVLVDDGVLNA